MSKSKNGFSQDLRLYQRLLSNIKPYRGIFALSIFGFLVFSALDVLAADVMQYLIDSMGGVSHAAASHVGAKTGIISTILRDYFHVNIYDSSVARIYIPLILVAIVLLRGGSAFIGTYFIKSVGSHVVCDIRQQMFNQMMHLPSAYILERHSGSLISRITYNVGQITTAVTTALATVFRNSLTVIFLFSYLVYINWRLTLVFLVLLPVIAFIVSRVSHRFRKLSKRLQSSMGDVTHVVSEGINGNRDMRIYGAQASEIQRFATVNQYTMKQELKIALADAAFSPTIQVLLTSAIAVLVWIGLDPKIVASMSPGLFVSYLIAAAAIGKPLRQLTQVINTIQKALAAADDIFATLDEPVEVETGTKTLEKAQGHLRFDNVNFRYASNEQNTLSEISFSAQAGQTIALVGASGGGKSTLANLIPRFFNVTSGEIYLDDVPISELTLKSLRKQIAFVSQNVVLMNDTVRKNIAYGEMENCSDEQIIEAAKLANAHEFISQLEQGYDSVIGDNGLRLSGGQRQRLAIARAILKKAPVLIMDEATSALDNQSERLIQQAMNNIQGSCTTIVIAHRLSTIESADLILVLQEGRIIERGKHQQLLALNGRYAELHHQFQAQGESAC